MFCCTASVIWDARNLKKVGEHLGLNLMMEPTKNEQLMALANTNVDFPDVFGDVCGIKTTLTRRIRPFNVLWYLVNVVTVMINLNDLPLYGSYDGSCSTASKYGSVKKIERVTLAELNNYVLNSPPQVGELHSLYTHVQPIITYTIHYLATVFRWCSQIATDSAVFVFLTMTNVLIAKVAQLMSASESLQQAALPRCIQDIINLTFQLKLSEIHFSSTGTDAVVNSAADEAFASKKAPTFKTACYT
ncbi:LOW QUALITY PROTEIN: hypothetical protein HID58_088415 [Brassica napus]|uniref:Uncharacterized protein n=1 Tax=Brassica napus TaxID=3708 RepID=A0ABQ7XW49_BRANA|nr:LOW QUALITY PROTEIN: hypothetical protein HID58_088415 [Brassica napus]